MYDKLELTVRASGSGKLAIINGKTYSLLRLYRHNRLGGIFCLVVAGRTPLRADDLDEHWKVIHSGCVYIALDCRPFSYHLIQGDGSTTDAPRWPRLKSPAAFYAFVGPTEDAIQTQASKIDESYRYLKGVADKSKVIINYEKSELSYAKKDIELYPVPQKKRPPRPGDDNYGAKAAGKKKKRKPLSQKDRLKIKGPSKTRGDMPPPSIRHKSKKDYNRQKTKRDIQKELISFSIERISTKIANSCI